MNLHLIDGTFELFRHYYALPKATDTEGQEMGAVRGVLGSIVSMIESGATHVAVATDHVIESFRNDLWPGYKDSSGIEPDLWAQFHPLEDALEAMGVAVWRMREFEADDGLAAGAALGGRDDRVERVLICTPDKDLAQCVRGTRIVQFDRRERLIIDEQGVIAKFGVRPTSIPDYLALVGDSADGYPGLPGWGKKSASTLLARYEHLEHIPDDPASWDVTVRGAARLAATLAASREQAMLFRTIATVREDAPVAAAVDDVEWLGVTPVFTGLAERLRATELSKRLESRMRPPLPPSSLSRP